MRVDFSKHEVGIILAADATKGLWSFQKITGRTRTVRQGGQLPTEASAHTLLATALTVALRSHTKNEIQRLLYNAPRGVDKPRIIVTTLDPTFGAAINGIMCESNTAPRLRAGRNFIGVLVQQLNRFQVDFEYVPNDKDAQILGGWIKNTLTDPKLLDRIPSSLRPSAASQVQ